jgi:phosphoglycerol transferase MdoB-like AlkP superfamily enzyme
VKCEITCFSEKNVQTLLVTESNSDDKRILLPAGVLVRSLPAGVLVRSLLIAVRYWLTSLSLSFILFDLLASLFYQLVSNSDKSVSYNLKSCQLCPLLMPLRSVLM